MRITIGDKSQECMKLLGIDQYPFSSRSLSSAFRIKMKQVHPDKEHGDHNMAVEVIQAYKHLKNLALDIGEETPDISEEEEFDLFRLWETCPSCKGRKIEEIHQSKMPCPECTFGPSIFFWASRSFFGRSHLGKKLLRCNRCGGSGKFIKDGVDKGVCFKCNGTGTVEVTCRYCGGRGWIGEEKVETRPCYKCGGKGKIELNPWNPVIPKGAVLNNERKKI
jgi:DnaJ-class molecular chaperone